MGQWYEVGANTLDAINRDRESRLNQAATQMNMDTLARNQKAAEAEGVAIQRAGELFGQLASGQHPKGSPQVDDDASVADPFIQTGSALLASGYAKAAEPFFKQGNELAKEERLRMTEERNAEKLETERSDRQISLTDRFLTNSNAASWESDKAAMIAAGADGTISESEAQALAALPYDPDAVEQLRKQAVTVAEQNKAKRLELSAQDLATDRRLNRSLRMQELELAKQKEQNRRIDEANKAKDGKSAGAADAKTVDLAEATIRTRLFGGRIPDKSKGLRILREMAPVIASRAIQGSANHPGITMEVAIQREITNAISNGELDMEAVDDVKEAKKKAEFTPKGRTRDAPLVYKRGMEMQKGLYYMVPTANGDKLGIWTGSSFKELE